MATQPSDYTELPAEVIAKPLAPVGLAGLDIINNAVHKAIWDGFANNRRADRAAVSFKLLSNTYEFPVVKPKRNSYEWYIPKGILKKNWIRKRTSLVPAVIVIFYDVEWNDPQWDEKMIECASRVQSIRAAVEGHATRVAVVVVQGAAAPPPSEYMLGAERAQALCAACEIQSKSLFVLPHADNLTGYIVRLENAFYDLAQNYYHHETKIIKQHRDHLNKTNHQYLFVRHQFKLGFLNELKQDLSTAHKHYTLAYNHLLECRVVDTNTYEVKTVAGYINYKLCKLLFALNLPRDAISQLRAHLDRYKNRIGAAELLFEHYAWVARQYSAFGELFDEAIRSGLPAIQSQHPGFYYRQAAQFTGLRRHATQSLCQNAHEYPTPDPLEGTVDFYGQRAWRPGRLSADPHDPQREQAAVVALQHREKLFNHSAVIISFLGNAISQFKTFHSPRMRKQLVVEMADEYYLCADYGKALTLLTHMLWDYRREQWWYLASHVLNRALQCAYLSAKIQDYLTLSVEALSKHIIVPNNDKERIYSNIILVLSVNIPNPELELPPPALNGALEAWKSVIDKDPLLISIDMSTIATFIETKATFTQQVYKLDDDVAIDVFIRMTHPSLVYVSRLSITVSSKNETIEIPLADNNGNTNLSFRGGEVRKLKCHFRPNPDDTGSEMHIKSVSFVLGDGKRKLVLNFNMSGTATQTSIIHPELLHFASAPKADHEFDSVMPTIVARLTSRESKLSIAIENQLPALQGEWFPTSFTISNNEECDISNLKMELSLLSTPDNPNPDASVELGMWPEVQPNPLQLALESVPKSSSSTNVFYLKSNRTTTIAVQLKTTYSLNNQPTLECSKDFAIKISVVKPFDVSAKFVSMKFQPIDKCLVEDPFIVVPEIKILSPWTILIEDTDLELTECYSYADEEKPPSCLKNIEVEEGTIADDAFCLNAKTFPKTAPIRVGLYNIKWKRVSNNSSVVWNTVMSSTSLPGLPIQDCPISVIVEIPEAVKLQTSMPLNCTLKGNVDKPTRLLIGVDGTDSFMFSGYKKRSVTVEPGIEERVSFNMHPLVCGSINLPKIKPLVGSEGETVSDRNSLVEELFQKSLPQNVFVMPNSNK